MLRSDPGCFPFKPLFRKIRGGQTRLQACLLMMFMVLTGCAVREISGLSVEMPGTKIQTFFVAAQRNTDQFGKIFGEDRTQTLQLAKVGVSIPPNHQLGQLEWKTKNPDPAREFALTRLERPNEFNAFLADIHQSKADRSASTFVFIHGYNTRAIEAVFRLAQIQEDFGMQDPSVLFTWPSAGVTGGYVYDRDSVLVARDDLELVLTELTRNGREVFVMAHSMGTHLLMETLRQAKHRNNNQLLNGVSGVILASPDIDPDVFYNQASAIGRLPDPFLIFASANDRALSVSSILTGQRNRVGNLLDASIIGRDDVTIVDFSKYSDGKGLNHLTPFTSPEAITFLKRAIRRDHSLSIEQLRDIVPKQN